MLWTKKKAEFSQVCSKWLCTCWLLLFVISTANADQQDDFTRQRLIQPRKLLPVPDNKQTKPALTPPEPGNTPKNAENGQTKRLIAVKRIEVKGSSVFTAEAIAPIIRPLEGRAVSLADLKQAADKITEKYVYAGYITTQAYIPPQAIKNGTVTIQVLEGEKPEIEIIGNNRLDPDYIRSRIELGANKPLQANQLEEQLRILKANPLIKDISASLQPTHHIGQTRLVTKVEEANPFWLRLTSDNYSPPSVGSIRTGIALGHRNLFGVGDELRGEYQHSVDGGLNTGEADYRLPVNSMDGTVELRAVISRADVGKSGFKSLGIRADTNMYEISFRQPIIKSLQEEFALSTGFSHRAGKRRYHPH
jgi:hemolysin activation/secretion protein